MYILYLYIYTHYANAIFKYTIHILYNISIRKTHVMRSYHITHHTHIIPIMNSHDIPIPCIIYEDVARDSCTDPSARGKALPPSRWGAGSDARDPPGEDRVKRDEPNTPQLWVERPMGSEPSGSDCSKTGRKASEHQTEWSSKTKTDPDKHGKPELQRLSHLRSTCIEGVVIGSIFRLGMSKTNNVLR